MPEKRKPGKSPSERGRNYTPLGEVVHCALPGAVSAAAPVGAEPTSTGRCAPCGQQMISVDFNLLQSSQGKLPFPSAGSASYSFVDLLPESLLESVFHLAS